MPARAASNRPAAAAIVSQLGQSVWRASQMGASHAGTMPTGYVALDRELPNGGWPSSVLTELLVQQAGIGEMRLLRPALATIARTRRVALVQPPHMPQVAAWLSWGMAADKLLWVKTARTADALWSAEQILRNGSCGALLFWQMQVRPEALRRLHLAAQASDTVFWMLRPLAAAHEASPSPLRLALRPAPAGLSVEIVKRRGPHHEDVLTLPFADAVITPSFHIFSFNHAPVDRSVPAATAARDFPATLV